MVISVQVVETSVITTYDSPSQGNSHSEDQLSRPCVTPGVKPYTVMPINL